MAETETTGRSPGAPRAAPLLRRVLRGPGRSLEITRAGWWFIGLTLLVGFAAINSGSNLLHIVFGCQLGVIIGSGVLSEWMLRDVIVERRLMGPAHAGLAAPLELTLRLAPARTRPSLALSVEDDDLGDRQGVMRPVFVVALRPGAELRVDTTVTLPIRGRACLPAFTLVTRFPFGLFVKRRHLPDPREIIVAPRPAHVRTPPRSTASEGERDRHATGRAREGEFHGLIEHRPGEDATRVHWRATARRGRLVVTRHDPPIGTEHWLSLPSGPPWSPEFETALEWVTGEAMAMLAAGDVDVGLRDAGQNAIVDAGRGAAHGDEILRALALVGGPPPPALAETAARALLAALGEAPSRAPRDHGPPAGNTVAAAGPA